VPGPLWRSGLRLTLDKSAGGVRWHRGACRAYLQQRIVAWSPDPERAPGATVPKGLSDDDSFELFQFYDCWYPIYASFVSTWMGDVCFGFLDRRQQIEFESSATASRRLLLYSQLSSHCLELTVSISIHTHMRKPASLENCFLPERALWLQAMTLWKQWP
jgi:hypothetical protein